MNDCRFTYAHYGRILSLLHEGGFAFLPFSAPRPAPRTVWLRHDVDFAPEAALPLAALEARHGALATYFFQLAGPYYNLLDRWCLRCLARIEAMGHRIGLHFRADAYGARARTRASIASLVERELEILEGRLGLRADAVSFHKPSPAVMDVDFPSFINAYAPRFFSQARYLSDSGMRWPAGCPCERVPGGESSRYQILTHPEWWWITPGNGEERLELWIRRRTQGMRRRLRAELLLRGGRR